MGGLDSRERHKDGCADGVETQTSAIESAFQEFTERKDIAILLINQHVSSHRAPGLELDS
jgi:V-type H+-transporting ATPase subunit F